MGNGTGMLALGLGLGQFFFRAARAAGWRFSGSGGLRSSKMCCGQERATVFGLFSTVFAAWGPIFELRITAGYLKISPHEPCPAKKKGRIAGWPDPCPS